MGIKKIPFFFFVFFHLVPCLIDSAEICPIQWCTKDEPTIRFPFTLKDHGSEVCDSPCYTLSCDEMNKTVLELPDSGKFFVRNLYDFLHKIEIYDPDDCLPKRILKLNLLGTAYHLGELGVSYHKYSFLNCSSSIDIAPHTVIAVDVPTASIAPLNTSCLHIADVPIPNSPFRTDVPVDLNENFVLSYPACQKKSKIP
ncbi:hypothetical protein MKW92_038518 [Papaver armeniacum]|nr:hypothetical protein MKW92_038518 [Papaver armeniacum]